MRPFVLALAAAGLTAPASAQQPAVSPLRFEITVPAALRDQPQTGRMYVFLTRDSSPEPRLQVRHESDCTPFFGVDVTQLHAGSPGVIDGTTLGYPVASLRELPAGDYYVQGLLNVYTEFHRADGRTLWLHDDQWEGQQFNRSPGNLVSEVTRVHIDPSRPDTVRIALARALPPIELPPDTRWVKHVKIQSKCSPRGGGGRSTWVRRRCSRADTKPTPRDVIRRYTSKATSISDRRSVFRPTPSSSRRYSGPRGWPERCASRGLSFIKHGVRRTSRG